MGSKGPRSAVQARTAVKSEPEEPSELPVVTTIGVAQAGRGWVVVVLEVQGDRVLDREVISLNPEPKVIAAKRAQLEVLKQFVAPSGKVTA